MSERTSVLEMRDVRKSYGDLEVLHGVNLQVSAGEQVAIVGPSGSGKSTLLHIVGTLERPTSGAVVIDGYDTTELSEAELAGLRSHRVGFVFQSFHLIDGLSATENVAQGLLYSGVRRAERTRRAREVLERVGLGHRLGHDPRILSGGERQRVAVARALLNRPAIVFADEPTGNLDSHSGEEVLNLFDELHRDGTTIVVITHEHEVAARMARQVEIRDGLITHDSQVVAA
ncbi:MAG: ABC transporter ATP-binding protein [Actinomycetota bacterium]|nr:ABC transporter ATP-binding protein [Actinomycetota bacterium]